MRSDGDLRLALVLIKGGGRRDLVRLVAMALGVVLAVFAALLGLAVPRVASAARDVEAARQPVFRDVAAGDRGLVVHTSPLMVGSRPWTRVVAGGVSAGAPRPPGLMAWPAQGLTVPSPALRSAVEADPALLAAVGTLAAADIGADGLTAPDELFSYTVAAARASGTPAAVASVPGGSGEPETLAVVTGFGGSSFVGAGKGAPLGLEIGLLVVTPAVIFLFAALRLSAVSRARRSFALGLAGMSPSRNARLYAWEMTVVALVGLLLAALAYNGVQGAVGASGALGVQWWPEQGHLGWPTLVVCGAVAVGIVRVVARRTMAATASRSRSQRTERRDRVLIGLAFVLGVPSLGFLAVVCVRGWLNPSKVWASDQLGELVMLAVLAGTIGVILAVPRLVELIGENVGARVRPAVGLGLLGAAFRGPAARRLIAFVAGAVMLTGVSIGFLTGLHRGAVGDPDRATIAFSIPEVNSDPEWFAKLPAGAFTVQASLPGPNRNYEVTIGNCPAVKRYVEVVFPSGAGACRDAVQRGDGTTLFDPGAAEKFHSFSVGVEKIAVPAGPLTSRVTWDVKFPVRDAAWARNLPDGEITYWVDKTKGSDKTVLAALNAQFPGLTIAAGVKNPDQLAVYQQQIGIVRASMSLGILLSLCSFLLGAMEGRWARTRTVTTLAAIGTPRRVLRLANLVEFAFPVLVAAIPAGLVSVLGGWAIVSFQGSDGMFSGQVLWWTICGALAATTIAATAGWATGGAEFRREALADA